MKRYFVFILLSLFLLSFGCVNDSECGVSSDCQDSNPCTVGVCEGGKCKFNPVHNGVDCGEELICYEGVCQEESDVNQYWVEEYSARQRERERELEEKAKFGRHYLYQFQINESPSSYNVFVDVNYYNFYGEVIEEYVYPDYYNFRFKDQKGFAELVDPNDYFHYFPELETISLYDAFFDKLEPETPDLLAIKPNVDSSPIYASFSYGFSDLSPQFEDVRFNTIFTPVVEDSRVRLKIDSGKFVILNDYNAQYRESLSQIIITVETKKRTCNFIHSEEQEKYLRRFNCDLLKKLEDFFDLSFDQNYALAFFSEDYSYVNPVIVEFTDVVYESGFFLAPNLILVNSNNRQDIKQVLLHESSHILLNDFALPLWFEEGLAEYNSYNALGTGRKTIKPSDIYEWNPAEDEISGDEYQRAYSFVKLLVRDYGDEIIPKIIEKMGKGKKESNLNEKLEKTIQEVTEDQNFTLSKYS